MIIIIYFARLASELGDRLANFGPDFRWHRPGGVVRAVSVPVRRRPRRPRRSTTPTPSSPATHARWTWLLNLAGNMPLTRCRLRIPLAAGHRHLGMPKTRHRRKRSNTPPASNKSTSTMRISRAASLLLSPSRSRKYRCHPSTAAVSLLQSCKFADLTGCPSLLTCTRTHAASVFHYPWAGHALDNGPYVDMPPDVSVAEQAFRLGALFLIMPAPIGRCHERSRLCT